MTIFPSLHLFIMSRQRTVEGMLFVQLDDGLYFHPDSLLEQLFSDPFVRHQACEAFQARPKPPYRLCNPRLPYSAKLYRLDDLPQMLADPNHMNIITPFLRDKLPLLQARVYKAFGLKRTATVATQTSNGIAREE